MRNMNTSLEMAELAVDFRARGLSASIWRAKKVVILRKTRGRFSLHPAENFNITIHAGEGYGKESICRRFNIAERTALGMERGSSMILPSSTASGELGHLAQYVLDKPSRWRFAC